MNTGIYYLRARYMSPSTGTFISMDSYQGSIYDPVTLHKYLYANANSVMYTDPSGYNGELIEAVACVALAGTLFFGYMLSNQSSLSIFLDLKKNLSAAAIVSDEFAVTQRDWKNVIIDFPSYNYDKELLVTTVMWLASWRLFKVIYEVEEADSKVETPGVPENKDEDDEEKDGKNRNNGKSKKDEDIPQEVKDLIKDAKDTTNKTGIARNYEKTGGYEKALEDFNRLNPQNVKDIQTQYGPGKVGSLKNGGRIVVRPGSKTGGSTLEIVISNSKIYKIRY